MRGAPLLYGGAMKSSRRWVRPNWFSSRRANFLILLRCYLTSWVGARLKLSDVFQSGRGIQSFLGETGAWEWVQEKFVLGVGRNGEPGLEEKPISGGERAAVRGKEKRPGEPHSLTLSFGQKSATCTSSSFPKIHVCPATC